MKRHLSSPFRQVRGRVHRAALGGDVRVFTCSRACAFEGREEGGAREGQTDRQTVGQNTGNRAPHRSCSQTAVPGRAPPAPPPLSAGPERGGPRCRQLLTQTNGANYLRTLSGARVPSPGRFQSPAAARRRWHRHRAAFHARAAQGLGEQLHDALSDGLQGEPPAVRPALILCTHPTHPAPAAPASVRPGRPSWFLSPCPGPIPAASPIAPLLREGARQAPTQPGLGSAGPATPEAPGLGNEAGTPHLRPPASFLSGPPLKVLSRGVSGK